MPQSNTNKPHARLHSPLEPGVLLLKGYSGSEHLSKPYQFTINLYSSNKKKSAVQFEKLLGKEFTIESDVYSREKDKCTGECRYLSGICLEFSEGAQDSLHTSYTAVIGPKLHLLTLQKNNRIFQQKSVPDILKQILPQSGTEFQLTGQYDPREYCTQHRESDFDFAHRLMETEGIFYFFKHDKSGHTMVLADSSSKHPTVQEPSSMDLDPSEGGSRRGAHLSSWNKAQRMKTGKVTLRDYNFQLPNSNLEASKTVQDSTQAGQVEHPLQVGGNDSIEIYHYPGGFAKCADGVSSSGGDQSANLQKLNTANQRMATLMMQAETAKAMAIQADSNCTHLIAGHKFTLQESAATKGSKVGGDYILTEVGHDGNIDVDNRTGDQGQFNYSNKLSFIPAGIEYKPHPQTTPKPVAHGVHSATVTGPPGEEIHTDKYGRVKVQFHWDRDGKNDANSSCWVRVASSWAGKQWGSINIPRVGQEVMINHMEGDPDSPIIMGSVPNPNTMPPETLPDNKTQSGIKSCSSPGGGTENFNKVWFEDKAGSEMLTIHAEKDETLVVEHDKTENVGNDETITITNDRTETVGQDQSITVNGQDSLTVAMSQTIDIGTTQDETVGADRTTTIGASDTLTVTGPQTVTVGVLTITSDAAVEITSGAEMSLTAGAVISITSGATMAITTAGALTITAPTVLINGVLMVNGLIPMLLPA